MVQVPTMAVLGVQLVFSMITASFLSKISPRKSFARWLLCSRLVRYLHPTDDELRTIAGVPSSGKKARKNEQKGKPDNLTVPKSIHIQLESSPIDALDVIQLKFYTEYQWLIDFTFCTFFVYIVTEIYYSLVNLESEFNLSMVWCLVVFGFAIKVMYSLTAIYFHADSSGERIMCIMFGFFFLVFGMAILIVDENTLEFGLEKAYGNFSQEARSFLENQGIGSTGPMSLLTFRIILVLTCAILGTFMTFPGLRLAKMHHDALRFASENPFKQLLLYTNMIFPLFISLLWIKPIMREYLVKRDYNGRRIIVDDETFDTIRIVVILVFCLFRFILLPTHLQSHLNTAHDKILALRKEAGRISTRELQQMVTSVFFYLCVVALQYLAPLVLLAVSAIMMKTLGEFSMLSSFGIQLPSFVNASTPKTSSAMDGDSISETAAQFSLALSNLRHVFTPLCFRGLFSFLCWWIVTSWFTTSAFGLVYYSYFQH